MSGRKRRFDALLAEDDEPVDDGFQPFTGPEQIPLEETSSAGEPRWGASANPDSGWLERGREGLGDAMYSGAHGVFTGLGMNPSELSPRIAARQLLGQERSPYASAAGGFGGELAVQAASGVGPVLGGALSGIGNTQGELEDKAVGAAVGGTLGKVGDVAMGGLSKALGLGSQAAAREGLNRGLTQSGAETADLRRLDELGGREYFAEGQKRLGLRGKPQKVLSKAEQKVADLEAQRAEIVGSEGPDVDASALYSSVAGASQRYPGISPVRNATEKMAGDVYNISQPRGAIEAAPWDKVNAQRQYYGDKTNFASGTPEANVRKSIYGAYNDEMGDALSLRDPGAGDAWRQAGRDEQIAIEMGDIASKGVDRARNRDFSFTGTPARMLKDAVSGPGPKELQAGLLSGASMGARGMQEMSGPASGQFASAMAERSGAGNPDTAEQALTLLQSNPRALGGFASKFAEAAASPTRDAVTALIAKLTLTDQDFRTRILPQLSAARR